MLENFNSTGKVNVYSLGILMYEKVMSLILCSDLSNKKIKK